MTKTEETLYNTDASKIICFDLETTGTHPHRDEILQIAIINGYGDVLFNELIKPRKKKRWPEAEKINNISPADVQNCQPFSFHKERIQDIFNNADYVIGYNCIDFDIPFIEAEGIKVSCKKYDVMVAAKKYIKKTTGKSSFRKGYFRLMNLARYDFGFYDFDAHDALGDCQATLHVFNSIVSDDSFGNTTQSNRIDNDDFAVRSEIIHSTKKSKRGKMTVFGLILLIIGLLGVVASARIITGSFGIGSIFRLNNFSNYVFDGFMALILIGLLVIVLVIRGFIRSRG